MDGEHLRHLAPSTVMSHGFQSAAPATMDPSIARKASRGKDVRAVPVAAGMTSKQHAGMGRGGMGHSTVDSGGLVVGGNVRPFDKQASPQLSRGKLAPVMRGMKNRTINGADPVDVLATAVRSGGRAFDCGD